MDPNTGHLVRLLVGEPIPEGYVEIPEPLNVEAEALLGEQMETYIDLDSRSPLSQFAADCRRQKAKRKVRNRRLRKETKQHKRQ